MRIVKESKLLAKTHYINRLYKTNSLHWDFHIKTNDLIPT